MEKTLEKQYATVLLTKGLNLQQHQILVINAPVEAEAFTKTLTETAYQQGASEVVINWHSDDITRLRYVYEEQANFEILPDWRRDFSLTYYHKGAAFLSLVSANPDLLNGIDSAKIIAWQKAQHASLREYIDGMMASKVTWLVAAVASKKWASLLYPTYPAEKAMDMLWKEIITCSRADHADCLTAWDKHLAVLEKRRDWLTAQHFTKLIYQSANGTHITIGLPEKHMWQGGAESSAHHISFNANIPTEEVYTAPDKTKVNGIVYNTKPLVYNGTIIDHFSITFEHGKAIAVKAETGEKVLTELLAMDEGAPYLGEIALVPYHSPISMSGILFYETLFDENASCHLAFGKAYPTCLDGGSTMDDEEITAAGLNDSMVHVDFMIGTADLSITGIRPDGSSVPVFLNGDFTI